MQTVKQDILINNLLDDLLLSSELLEQDNQSEQAAQIDLNQLKIFFHDIFTSSKTTPEGYSFLARNGIDTDRNQNIISNLSKQKKKEEEKKSNNQITSKTKEIPVINANEMLLKKRNDDKISEWKNMVEQMVVSREENYLRSFFPINPAGRDKFVSDVVKDFEFYKNILFIRESNIDEEDLLFSSSEDFQISGNYIMKEYANFLITWGQSSFYKNVRMEKETVYPPLDSIQNIIDLTIKNNKDGKIVFPAQDDEKVNEFVRLLHKPHRNYADLWLDILRGNERNKDYNKSLLNTIPDAKSYLSIVTSPKQVTTNSSSFGYNTTTYQTSYNYSDQDKYKSATQAFYGFFPIPIDDGFYLSPLIRVFIALLSRRKNIQSKDDGINISVNRVFEENEIAEILSQFKISEDDLLLEPFIYSICGYNCTSLKILQRFIQEQRFPEYNSALFHLCYLTWCIIPNEFSSSFPKFVYEFVRLLPQTSEMANIVLHYFVGIYNRSENSNIINYFIFKYLSQLDIETVSINVNFQGDKNDQFNTFCKNLILSKSRAQVKFTGLKRIDILNILIIFKLYGFVSNYFTQKLSNFQNSSKLNYSIDELLQLLKIGHFLPKVIEITNDFKNGFIYIAILALSKCDKFNPSQLNSVLKYTNDVNLETCENYNCFLILRRFAETFNLFESNRNIINVYCTCDSVYEQIESDYNNVQKVLKTYYINEFSSFGEILLKLIYELMKNDNENHDEIMQILNFTKNVMFNDQINSKLVSLYNAFDDFY